MKRTFYHHLYPKIWNRVKFRLYRDMNLCYKGELPDYVKAFCEKLNIILIPFEEIDNYTLEERFFEEPPTKGSETVDDIEMLKVDYDAMYSESWDSIEDCKICYVECTPDNICTTLYSIKTFAASSTRRGWKELGYSIVPLVWEETIPFMKEEQINIIENMKGIHIGKIENLDKYETRISIFPEAKDSIKKSKVVHITSKGGGDILPVYRRYFLNQALKEKYGEDLATNAFSGLAVSELCIVSRPSYYVPNSKYIIYDRTDNWRASTADDANDAENEVLHKANLITCSSKWLYNNTVTWLKENRPNDDVPVIYIPNGNRTFDYPANMEKFEKKTAVYIGNRLAKVDLQLLFLLCETHSDWNFMLYAAESTNLLSIPDNLTVHEMIDMKDLFPVLCKCHVGLCLLNPSDWTKGMLPNKTFSYFNAHLPVVYSGIPDMNLEDYKDCAFNIADISSLDEALTKADSSKFDGYTRDWDKVVSELMSVIEQFENSKGV